LEEIDKMAVEDAAVVAAANSGPQMIAPAKKGFSFDDARTLVEAFFSLAK
jgi:hypothetical protein